MWNKNVEVVPVIRGVTSLVEKNLKKHLSRTSGQHNIYNLEKLSMLGTAHNSKTIPPIMIVAIIMIICILNPLFISGVTYLYAYLFSYCLAYDKQMLMIT